MFSPHSPNCRFCLRTFEEDEKQIVINSFIARQFSNITQVDLVRSELLPQNICEMCFDTARDFAEFKTKLIHNQQTLMESVKYEVSDTMLVEDGNLEDLDPVQLQGFTLFEMVKDEFDNSFCEEEHLDPNIEELQEAVEVKIEEPVEGVSGKRKEKKKLCSGE